MMFKVGDRVRVKRYWTGLIGTISRLPNNEEPYGDHYQIYHPDYGKGLFEPGSFEALNASESGQIIPDLGPTLLDQFAMAALTGLCGSGDVDISTLLDERPTDQLAAVAYSVAQAMLKARPQ